MPRLTTNDYYKSSILKMTGKQNNHSLSEVVTLNVGGEKFETTRQTLLYDPNSMLAKMFDPVSPLQPGEVQKLNVAN